MSEANTETQEIQPVDVTPLPDIPYPQVDISIPLPMSNVTYANTF